MNSKIMRVLLVDDEEDHVELIRRALKGAAFEAELAIARSLDEARAILADNMPDIMIADYRLPDGEGTALLPGNGEKCSMPIVILTGHGDETVATAALKAGAMDYIVKSDATFADIPHIIERTLREWQHITARRQAEESLAGNERHFRTLFQSVADYVLILELQESGPPIIVDANDAAFEKHGYAREEMIGKPISFLDSDSSSRRIDSRLQLMRESDSVRFEVEHVCKGGSTFSAEVAGRMVESNGQKLFYAVERDITGRKQAGKLFQALLEHSVSSTGKAFFGSTVHSLCDLLDVDCAIVSEIEKEGHVRALAMQLDDKAVEGYEYDLPGTPCNEATGKGYCIIPEKVCERFPDDKDLIGMQAEGYAGIPVKDTLGKPVGILCVISRSRLVLPANAKDVFEILAARVATEIGRMRAVAALEQKLDEIERMNRLMVGRELKMEELRQEIKKLKNEINSLRSQ